MKKYVVFLCLALASCTKEKSKIEVIEIKATELNEKLTEAVKNKDRAEWQLLNIEAIALYTDFIALTQNTSDLDKEKIVKISSNYKNLKETSDFFDKNIIADTDSEKISALPSRFFVYGSKDCFEIKLDAYKMKYQSPEYESPIPYTFENNLLTLNKFNSRHPDLIYKLLKQRKIENTNVIIAKEIHNNFGYFYIFDNDDLCQKIDRKIILIK